MSVWIIGRILTITTHGAAHQALRSVLLLGAAFRAHHLRQPPGLKPWAKLFRPFGPSPHRSVRAI
jgi:hypothetical protein